MTYYIKILRDRLIKYYGNNIMMSKEWIRWSKIEELIDEKIKSIREQEMGIDDPITLSFLQVHEEILLKLKDDLQDNIVKESSIKNND